MFNRRFSDNQAVVDCILTLLIKSPNTYNYEIELSS